MRVRWLLLVLAVIVCATCSREGGPTRIEWDRFAPEWRFGVDSGPADLAVADVTGTDEPEIVLLEGGTVRLLSLAGQLLAEHVVSDAPLQLGFCEDVDGDEKADIVLGGIGNNGVRLLVVSGSGDVVQQVFAGSGSMIRTTPQCFRDGHIYFIAGSSRGEPPGYIGRTRVGSRDVDWIEAIGPIPHALSVRGRYVAVSHRAVCWPTEDQAVVAKQPNQHALLLFEESGEKVLNTPFGPPADMVWYESPQYSRLTSLLVNRPDHDEPAMLVAAERISDLYRGPTELYLYDIRGELIARHVADMASAVSMRPLGTEGSVAVTWSTTGDVTVFDVALRPAYTYRLPGDLHDARIALIEDLDDTRGPEILLRDLGRVHVLSSRLSPVFSTAVAGRVHTVAALRSSRKMHGLAVLGTSLALYAPAERPTGTLVAFSRPPGLPLTVNGTSLRLGDPLHLPEGSHTIAAADGRPVEPARLRVEAGTLTEITVESQGEAAEEPVVEAPVEPSGPWRYELVSQAPRDADFVYRGLHDMVASPGAELVFIDRQNGRARLYTADTLEPIMETTLSGSHSLSRFSIARDFDGDGYADLVRVCKNEEGSTVVSAFTADGRRLWYHPFVMGHDTTGRWQFLHERAAIVSFTSGWGLKPRMVTGVDVDTREVSFVYPVAGFPQNVVLADSTVYVSSYTPSNGHEVVWDDGTVDRDSEIFIHAVGLDGTPWPHRRPLDHGGPGGQLRFRRFADHADGTPRLVFYTTKYHPYTPGTPGFYEVRVDGTVRTILTGPRDTGPRVLQLQANGRDYLAMGWNAEQDGRLYDASFRPIAAVSNIHDVFGVAFLGPEVEWVAFRRVPEKGVAVTGLKGTVHQMLTLDDDTFGGVGLVYEEGAEVPHVLLWGEDTMALYSIRGR